MCFIKPSNLDAGPKRSQRATSLRVPRSQIRRRSRRNSINVSSDSTNSKIVEHSWSSSAIRARFNCQYKFFTLLGDATSNMIRKSLSGVIVKSHCAKSAKDATCCLVPLWPSLSFRVFSSSSLRLLPVRPIAPLLPLGNSAWSAFLRFFSSASDMLSPNPLLMPPPKPPPKPPMPPPIPVLIPDPLPVCARPNPLVPRSSSEGVVLPESRASRNASCSR
mmetsp:Transcript_79905/g.126008  ORF Transcript_79905/g.126008 Transcript_79905/m.126008 type:complete len:219 (+) Transcript_79905:378-1034(+)